MNFRRQRKPFYVFFYLFFFFYYYSPVWLFPTNFQSPARIPWKSLSNHVKSAVSHITLKITINKSHAKKVLLFINNSEHWIMQIQSLIDLAAKKYRALQYSCEISVIKSSSDCSCKIQVARSSNAYLFVVFTQQLPHSHLLDMVLL